ncbi:DUF3558 domain-containing protein [Actinokineospora iranica]|uniref:DUF3558 domain-containing protein n=1 Tax=Actinokineospora iranica TaxID=1271860 RepID=A0A1G6PKI7_9PSEU|nr:DUF3558 domain-containing protein [Actinokineospora iranica]SDC80752.1 Protein of unknown function [Actinokineospora iranica]
MRHPARTLTSLALTAAALTACTESGTPTPTTGGANNTGTTTSSSAAAPDNTYGAPRVTDPIDAAALIDKPCALLTPAQVATLGLATQGKQDEAQGSQYCSWPSADEREDYTIGWLNPNKGGLSDHYRANQTISNFAAYFEPTTVSGYPGVFTAGQDRRGIGSCNLVVGIRDELTFRVGAAGGPKGKACDDKIKQIAEQAIATMKNGG